MDLLSDKTFVVLAEASRDIICTAATNGDVLFVNNAGRQHLGVKLPSGEARIPAAELVDAADQHLWLQLLAETLTSDATPRATIRFRHRSGGQIVPLVCQMVRLHGSRNDAHAVLIAQPVETADDSNAAVAPAESGVVGARGITEAFTGVVGHDLRNTLNVIVTCAHFVRQQTPDPSLHATLSRVLSSGQRMERMIDQLLDLTRIRSGAGIPLHVTGADLAIIVASICEQVQTRGRSEVRVAVHGDATGAWDVERITQVVATLADNAVQHGSGDQVVQVTVDGTQPAAVSVAVHNAGAVAEEIAPILFNPFRLVLQPRQRAAGLGLGLYIGKHIAVAHGGDIDVVSSAAAGTTVRLTLPRVTTAAQSAAKTSGFGADDLAILERVATAPRETSVTAHLFGAVPLHERRPQEYARIFASYARLLDVALEGQTYRTTGGQLTSELRDVAEQLGRLGAGAREVAELHARALRQRTQSVTLAKAQALTAEGRLVSFELMGHLLSFYRRRSGLEGRG